MKKFIFILLCWVISICGKGQNLVPNYSFETYTTCPTTSGQITYAFPWYGVTSGGSTDYFNSCSTSGYGVPKHGGIGYQYSKTGNGYAGVWVYSAGANYREYLQVPLTDSLQSGNCYLVEYYVNLFNMMKYALSSVDAHFSISAISSTGTGYVLNLSSQIKRFNPTAISDTVLWVKISGIYLASGGEKYLTIGNFSDDLNTDTINTGYSYYGSYYYIDDVSVIPIDSILGSMPANAGNDTTIINGDSAFIGQEISNLYCNWYIGATLIADSVSGLYVSPIVNTTYIVEQNLCGNITYDTVTVYVSGVGINENDWGSKITLFPNPSTNIVNIEGENVSSVIIYDVNGRVLIQTQQKQIDISALAKGVYSVVIISDKNKIMKKLVKM